MSLHPCAPLLYTPPRWLRVFFSYFLGDGKALDISRKPQEKSWEAQSHQARKRVQSPGSLVCGHLCLPLPALSHTWPLLGTPAECGTTLSQRMVRYSQVHELRRLCGQGLVGPTHQGKKRKRRLLKGVWTAFPQLCRVVNVSSTGFQLTVFVD